MVPGVEITKSVGCAQYHSYPLNNQALKSIPRSFAVVDGRRGVTKNNMLVARAGRQFQSWAKSGRRPRLK